MRYYAFLESAQFDTIMSYNSKQLEDSHTFIQWIFPTTTPSQFNDKCPVINIKELRSDSRFGNAKDKMIKSLALMKKHWGIGDNSIEDLNKFKLLNGHNGLRFSRVLQSLVYHELYDEVDNILSLVLDNLKYLSPRYVGDKTLWEIRLEQAIDEVMLL